MKDMLAQHERWSVGKLSLYILHPFLCLDEGDVLGGTPRSIGYARMQVRS
jgi:hypothetical protein